MKRTLLLWSMALAGPLIWFVTFGLGYGVAVSACALQAKPALFVISLISLAMTAGSGLFAWNEWRRLGKEYPGQASGAIPASRALASGGVALSALFSLIVLAQILVQVILEPCP